MFFLRISEELQLEIQDLGLEVQKAELRFGKQRLVLFFAVGEEEDLGAAVELLEISDGGSRFFKSMAEAVAEAKKAEEARRAAANAEAKAAKAAKAAVDAQAEEARNFGRGKAKVAADPWAGIFKPKSEAERRADLARINAQDRARAEAEAKADAKVAAKAKADADAEVKAKADAVDKAKARMFRVVADPEAEAVVFFQKMKDRGCSFSPRDLQGLLISDPALIAELERARKYWGLSSEDRDRKRLEELSQPRATVICADFERWTVRTETGEVLRASFGFGRDLVFNKSPKVGDVVNYERTGGGSCSASAVWVEPQRWMVESRRKFEGDGPLKGEDMGYDWNM